MAKVQYDPEHGKNDPVFPVQPSVPAAAGSIAPGPAASKPIAP
ncbi:MAG: hypothetical protein ABR907_11300 [Terracidiphilus sp.]